MTSPTFRRAGRIALTVLAVLTVWIVDSIVRGGAVRPALAREGFGETVTARNLVPRRCGWLDYEAAFWGNGRTTGEAQGYVCVSHSRPPAVHRAPFDEDVGADLFSEI